MKLKYLLKYLRRGYEPHLSQDPERFHYRKLVWLKVKGVFIFLALQSCQDHRCWLYLYKFNVELRRCDSDRPCPNVVAVPYDAKEFMIQCGLCLQYTNIMKGLKSLQARMRVFFSGEAKGSEARLSLKFVSYLQAHHHHRPNLYSSHYWTEASSQTVRAGYLSILFYLSIIY